MLFLLFVSSLTLTHLEREHLLSLSTPLSEQCHGWASVGSSQRCSDARGVLKLTVLFLCTELNFLSQMVTSLAQKKLGGGC